MFLLNAVIYLFYARSIFAQNLDNCESMQTCDECLQQIECAWCINPVIDLSGKNHHCRPKIDSKWCKDGFYSPELNFDIKSDLPFSNNSESPVQIKPQKIMLSLRKGEKYDLTFKYKMTENFPVDLYYLMDFSYSMKPHKNKLASLGNKLATAMRKLTTNFRLGFGSFVDKVELPYIDTKLKRPCVTCEIPYTFKNHLALTNDSDEFVKQVKAAKMSGNIDNPEGGFDAMMQVLVCEDIKWREQARHLLIYSSDDDVHISGDGKLGGIVEPNPARCYQTNEDDVQYDYPSVSQINFVAKQKKINIIFAIIKNKGNQGVFKMYKKLSKSIENANFGILDEKEESVIDLVVNNYKKIVGSVTFTSDAPKEVDIQFSSSCKNSTFSGRCTNVHVGDVLEFTATIQPRACLQNGKTLINIFPEAVNQQLIVELEVNCKCPCSEKTSPNFMEKSPECSNVGDMKCGVCECPPQIFGANCQCNSTYSESEDINNCIMNGTTSRCSDLGECICGKCECFKRPTEGELVYGKYCECNNYACKKNNGLTCSGKGRCNCKICECEAGYSGDACQCEDNPAKCLAPGSDKICSGHGECVCGKCECVKDKSKYSGRYCEDCVSCPAQRCGEFQNCAACKIHHTGEYDEAQCNSSCKYPIFGVNKLSGEDQINIKRCRVPDNDTCLILFEYEYENRDIVVRVLKEKVCTPPVNVIAWIAGVIGTVLIAGIIMLLIWKIVTSLHDRREYNRFVENTKKMKWAHNEINPLYRDAHTTFKNPTFNRLSSRFSFKRN